MFKKAYTALDGVLLFHRAVKNIVNVSIAIKFLLLFCYIEIGVILDFTSFCTSRKTSCEQRELDYNAELLKSELVGRYSHCCC